MNKNLFHIATLSDCPGCQQNKRMRIGDPISIILATAGALKNLLGIFGTTSRQLTSDDWNKLFPSTGYWTNKLKTYLAAHIKWDTDLKNIQPFTMYFIDENISQLSNGQFVTSNQAGVHANQQQFQNIVDGFYKILQSEETGTNQAGGWGTGMDLPTVLLIGAGIWFLFSQSQKGSRRGT